MEILFTFKCPFPKKHLKANKVKDINELNGFYIYDYNTAFVNLNSWDFNEMKDEEDIIKQVANTSAHEAIHHCIYGVTKNAADDWEEIIVEILLR